MLDYILFTNNKYPILCLKNINSFKNYGVSAHIDINKIDGKFNIESKNIFYTFLDTFLYYLNFFIR